MCGTRAGGMIGLGIGGDGNSTVDSMNGADRLESLSHERRDDEGGRAPGRTETREVIIAGINYARDEFHRLRGHRPSHVGLPDTYRMDLVGACVCGLQVRWLDGNAHSGIMVWREAGA